MKPIFAPPGRPTAYPPMVQAELPIMQRRFAKLKLRGPRGMKARRMYLRSLITSALTKQHPQKSTVLWLTGSMKWCRSRWTLLLQTPTLENMLARTAFSTLLAPKNLLTLAEPTFLTTAPLSPGSPWKTAPSVALPTETGRTTPPAPGDILIRLPKKENPPQTFPLTPLGAMLPSDTPTPLHPRHRQQLPLLSPSVPPPLTIPPTNLMVGPPPWEHPLPRGPIMILESTTLLDRSPMPSIWALGPSPIPPATQFMVENASLL